MAVNNVVHVNEYGLPLNAVAWLETHHQSKAFERARMIRDLEIRPGSFVVDAGCGPGLWTPLLAEAIGPKGRILGVDISRRRSSLLRGAAPTPGTARRSSISSRRWSSCPSSTGRPTSSLARMLASILQTR